MEIFIKLLCSKLVFFYKVADFNTLTYVKVKTERFN